MADDGRFAGRWDEARGNVKETIGEVRGDPRQQGEGRMDQTTGTANQGLAGVKDAARDAGDRAREAVTREPRVSRLTTRPGLLARAGFSRGSPGLPAGVE
jgi:uncharacterized protein YjbJ (UPF0337 family)